jgi:hypothetical protein
MQTKSWFLTGLYVVDKVNNKKNVSSKPQRRLNESSCQGYAGEAQCRLEDRS